MKRKEQLKKYKTAKIESLIKAEINLKEKIFDLKTKLALGKLKNTAQIKHFKKELARIKTLIRLKVIGELKTEKKISKT